MHFCKTKPANSDNLSKSSLTVVLLWFFMVIIIYLVDDECPGEKGGKIQDIDNNTGALLRKFDPVI